MWSLCLALAVASADEEVLRMEQPGWDASPPEAVSVDTEVVHGGQRSLKLSRTPDSGGQMSSVSRTIAPRVEARKLAVSGWFQVEGELDGKAGMFVRSGTRVYRKNIKATRSGWQRVRIVVKGPPSEIVVGALLEGTGGTWVDDFALEVDGVPWADVPKLPEPATESDTRFDAGSGLDLDAVSALQRDHLTRLAKVWGFAKVHHPAVRSGTVHVDYELFEVLPSVVAASDAAEVESILADWLDQLGPAPACTDCEPPAHGAQLAPDLSLMDGEGPVETRLRAIYAARGAEHHLIRLTTGVGNPDFGNEPAFADVDPMDPGHRLLAVFRFWNAIQWWSPYRDLVEGDWDTALANAIEAIIAAEDETGVAQALIRLHVPVSDTHSNLWNGLEHRPPQGDCMIPANLRFLGDDATVWVPGGGLELGDVVTAIDGVPVRELIEGWAPLFPSSNEPTRRRDLARNMGIGDCGPVGVTVRRSGQVEEVQVTRAEPQGRPRFAHDRPGEAFQLLSDDVAYLKLSAAAVADVPTYLQQASGTKGWVLDCRGYPSDFVLPVLAPHLFRERTPIARFTTVDLGNPGAFVMSEPVSLSPKKPFYEGKVAVVVDEVSQSSAEYHAMAFRAAPRAKVFGSTTAGADGNVSEVFLPGGWRSLITGIGVFTPDGSPTQRVGIVPDVEVIPTVERLAAGRDEVLEAAEAWILGEDGQATP